MRKQTGLTLVELMITIGIAAILLAIAVPSFSNMIQNNRFRAAEGNIIAALKLAHSEATKRSARVTLCIKKPGTRTCAPAASTSWNQGWMVFIDPNNNGDRDAAETILRVHDGLEQATLTADGGNISNYVSYVAGGFARKATGTALGVTPQNGALVLCDNRGTSDTRRVIRIAVTGYVAVTAPTTSESCPS